MFSDVSQFIYWDQNAKCSFENYSFILPDISIGNVGQLTVDLLLNNLVVEHLGHVVHPCFMPFIGADPFQIESKRLASSCEIYECKEKKLLILQIRSCVFPSKSLEFKDFITSFIKHFKFQQTIVVASSSSEYFSAEQLQGIPLHYFCTTAFKNEEILNQLKWKWFKLPNNLDMDAVRAAPIPGSFVSRDLYENCEEEGISLIILICVCSEGNNYPEALRVVDCINSWLALKQVKESDETWKMPISWKLPYGSAAPHTLY